jgi:sugar phosphate isomerase/epimerase
MGQKRCSVVSAKCTEAGVDVHESLDRAGVCQSTTAPWDSDDDIRTYAAAGWGAVGVWLQKLAHGSMSEIRFPAPLPSRDRIEAAMATVRSARLSVSHLVGSGFYTEPDDDARGRSIDHTVAAISVAEGVRAGCVVVIPGRLNRLSRRRALDLSAGAITTALDRSDGSRVCLAIEPVTDVDFVTTLDDALDLADLVDHDRVGVLPDSFHALRDPGTPEAIERAAGRILAVHVADAEGGATWARLPPGRGRLELADFVARIEATGYRGTYDVELISISATNTEAHDLLKRCADGMHSVFADVVSRKGEPGRRC